MCFQGESDQKLSSCLCNRVAIKSRMRVVLAKVFSSSESIVAQLTWVETNCASVEYTLIRSYELFGGLVA